MVQCRDRCSSADHLEYDPVNLEAIRIFERLEEEEEEIKNGMKWMQAEGTKASKIYLSSTETKVSTPSISEYSYFIFFHVKSFKLAIDGKNHKD